MGRPIEFDQDEALERALQVFWRHGYEGTSLDALCEAMQIGRQSLYNTFGDKRALFLVSNKVTSVSGAGTCIPAPDDCSLLYLATGQSEDLTYSVDGKTYRLAVSEIKRSAK